MRSYLHRHSSAANEQLRKQSRDELSEIRADGKFKSERIITSPQSAVIDVNVNGPKRVLNFCANNYLGLCNDPRVIDAGQRAMETHGAGLSSVRFICGTQDIHKFRLFFKYFVRELEKKIARFHGKDDSILYASCFDANAGLFEALLTPEDAVISDERNHASIKDGIRMCMAQRFSYKHLDVHDLESKLKQADGCRRKVIATDGVFSLDGDIAPLQEICQLADTYNAIVFTDECHATGFLGKTGTGTEELCGVGNKVDIINSTLGKAMGGATGGYTTGPQEVIDLLRQKSRPYLFSNSLAPGIVGAALEVFKILEDEPELAQSIAEKSRRFRKSMNAQGFTIAGHPDHPVCPVMIYDGRTTSHFADRMLDEGIYVIGFSFPVVPKDKARIRVQISVAHTNDQLKQLVSAFTKVGKELGVI